LFPNGLLEPSSCSNLDDAGFGLCMFAFQQFLQRPSYDPFGQYCNMSGYYGSPAPYFYSNCTCDDLTPFVAESGSLSCTVEGYYYDESNGPAFLPDFPTTSPYVTSVGAVARTFGSECTPSIYDPEIYCQATDPAGFSGGGGFSSVNPMPEYQVQFVQKYLANAPYLPPFGTYDPTMRAYPDVAFNGHNYIVSIGESGIYEGISPVGDQGVLQPVGGTSASSPAFAGMIVHLNDYFMEQGYPSLGFLNQLLYQMAQEHPDSFTDITPQDINLYNNTFPAGDFSGCTESYCCQYGFPITQGWDAGTGLGTPYYPIIRDYINQLFAKKFKSNK